MRRADRLFQIVQMMRARRLVTAGELARDLEVSERTIYRDVRDLMACGVPIEGEAGIGYMVPEEFDLPPLMFTRDELETLVLALRMVRAFGGAELAQDARSVLTKVEGVLPDTLRERLSRVDLFVPDFWVTPERTALVGILRRTINDRRKVSFRYRRADGKTSERTVRPLALTFWGSSWTLTAWCELRRAFRTFRPERIGDLRPCDEHFEDEPGRDLQAFLAIVNRERGMDGVASDRPGNAP